MQRDLRRLADQLFDLVVIGGGIYGTTAAWDATLRGLSVAIIDRADFGGGTSFNSLKTVHGGVRALQSGNIAELRQFVRERRALSRVAPHLVHPLPFVIPTYRGVSRQRWLMRIYFAVNDLLARDRNNLPDPAKHLPASRLLSRDECLRLNPLVDPKGVTGGIEWYDCQMHNSDRVNLSFLRSAVDRGAVAANYVESVGLVRRDGQVEGIVAQDRLGDGRFDIRARVVLNGAGPWAPTLLQTLAPELGSALPNRLSLAMNVIVARAMDGRHAVGGPAGARLLFVAPWRRRALIGTSHDRFDGAAGDVIGRRPAVERFLADVNQAFPRLAVGLEDVRLVHRGLLPATAGVGGDVRLLKTSAVRNHRVDGVDGLVSILGVRYTTARDTARRAVDTVFDALGRPAPVCRTEVTPLAGGDIDDLGRFVRDAEQADTPGVRVSTRRRVALSYGSTQERVLATLRTTPSDRASLGVSCDVTRAEVRHATREEMAVRLSDAVMRRTEAGSAGHPGDDALEAAAEVMAAELGWSRERIVREIDDVRQAYVIPG